MSTNAFRATTVSNDPVGLCFEPKMALANHSCIPNAVTVFDGRKFSLRALHSIKTDEQIFISYLDDSQIRETRQAELKERYFFTCACEKCVKDDSPYESWQKSPSVSTNAQFDLLLNRRALRNIANSAINADTKGKLHNAPKEVYTIIPKLLDIARETPDQIRRLKSVTQALMHLSPMRKLGLYAQPPCPTVLHELYLFYIDNESYPSALILLLFKYLNCDVFTRPQPHHPTNVVNLFAVAKLCKLMPSLSSGDTLMDKLLAEGKEAFSNIDWTSAAQVLLILVLDLARLSHGTGSRFMTEVRASLVEVEDVQKPRGMVGEALKQWGERGDACTEGKVYAEKVCEGLRRLGGLKCAEEVMDWGLDLVDE